MLKIGNYSHCIQNLFKPIDIHEDFTFVNVGMETLGISEQPSCI